VPYLGHEEPRRLSYDEIKAGAISDENIWVWDLLHQLKAIVESSLVPLDEYLVVMQGFNKEISLDVDKYFESMYGNLMNEASSLREEDNPNEEERLGLN